MNSILRHVTWRAVLISGLVAGTLFLLTDVILAPAMLKVDGGLTLKYL